MRGQPFVWLLLVGLGLLTVVSAAPPHPSFSLAILRRDGILVPFASYDGHWKNLWPVPGKGDLPISVNDLPKTWWLDKKPITDWTLFFPGPERPGPGSPRPGAAEASPRPKSVHVTGITSYLASCLPGFGLRTDYKPAILPPPPPVHPYPKDALAFSGDVQIGQIEIVDPKDPVALDFAKKVPPAFTEFEDKAVAEYMRGGWTHSYTEAEREKVPVSLEALYRTHNGPDGMDVYYYEVVKRYFLPKHPSPEEAKCDLVSFGRGWFLKAPASPIDRLRLTVTVTSCDFRNVAFMLPLGTVTVDKSPQWIVQLATPSGESYVVIEPKPPDAVAMPLSVPGGDCNQRDSEGEERED